MFNFDGSQRLALQIEHGAKADVFASADERWMARVQAHGLITGTPQAFACNELVVITPRANPGQIKRLEDLARSGVQVAIAADAVPVGRYTRDVLVKLQEAPRFGGDYAARVLRNVVSEEDQVRAVVGKVELGEVDAGIVYRSDASGAAAENLQMLGIPPAYNIVATYPVAALRDSANPLAAQRFIEVLLSRGRTAGPASTALSASRWSWCWCSLSSHSSTVDSPQSRRCPPPPGSGVAGGNCGLQTVNCKLS